MSELKPTPTNDERREVAARLRRRNLAEGISSVEASLGFNSAVAARWVVWSNLVSVLFLGRDVVSLHEITERLADLIEPEERTCKAIPTGKGTAFCSECDAEYMGSIMTNEPPDYVTSLRYCPNCGARVVME